MAEEKLQALQRQLADQEQHVIKACAEAGHLEKL